MKRSTLGSILLFIAAVIWGSAFVAQSAGMDYVGPLTYSFSRSLLGFAILVPGSLVYERLTPAIHNASKPEKQTILKNSVIGGLVIGLIYFFGNGLQQLGIVTTGAGKTGFITSLYIVMVPIISVVLKRKVHSKTWICAAVAIVGFCLLCFDSHAQIAAGDFLVLGCAFVYSFHILAIEHFTSKPLNGVLMSCLQFGFASILFGICAFVFEKPTWSAVFDARVSILYGGLLSCGVAYTLQILGQALQTDSAAASLIMSTESVFAVIGGMLILNERMSAQEAAGCVFVFVAVIVSQLDLSKWMKPKKGNHHAAK